jgi:hypothetical protein
MFVAGAGLISQLASKGRAGCKPLKTWECPVCPKDGYREEPACPSCVAHHLEMQRKGAAIRRLRCDLKWARKENACLEEQVHQMEELLEFRKKKEKAMMVILVITLNLFFIVFGSM